MKWTDVIFLGGAVIAIGAIAKYTGAGKGVTEVAGGLEELTVAPFRGIGRGLGELGGGIKSIAESFGAIGKGISEAVSSVTGGLGVKEGCVSAKGMGECEAGYSYNWFSIPPSCCPTTRTTARQKTDLDPESDYAMLSKSKATNGRPKADVGILYQLGFNPSQVASMKGTGLTFDEATALRLGLRPRVEYLLT